MRDLDEVFARLEGSPFRRRFKLGARERGYLHDRGMPAVLEHARGFIEQRLAPAAPANDGRQTPMRGHPAFVAQHATGACCRGCLAKWHGIAAGRPLTPPECDHVLAALQRWLDAQAAPC